MLTLFWTVGIGIIWAAALLIVGYFTVLRWAWSEPTDSGAWDFPAGVAASCIALLLVGFCIGLVAIQVRQLSRMRGHKCKESAALERALKIQISFAIGGMISLSIESSDLFAFCAIGGFSALILGLIRYIQLKDAMNNGL